MGHHQGPQDQVLIARGPQEQVLTTRGPEGGHLSQAASVPSSSSRSTRSPAIPDPPFHFTEDSSTAGHITGDVPGPLESLCTTISVSPSVYVTDVINTRFQYLLPFLPRQYFRTITVAPVCRAPTVAQVSSPVLGTEEESQQRDREANGAGGGGR